MKNFLSKIKDLIIYKEYSARENIEKGMSAKQLYLEVKNKNSNVKYCGNIKSVLKNIKPNSSVAFVGAGDIYQIAKQIVE